VGNRFSGSFILKVFALPGIVPYACKTRGIANLRPTRATISKKKQQLKKGFVMLFLSVLPLGLFWNLSSIFSHHSVFKDFKYFLESDICIST
jgi:hypothetical protein